MSQCMVNFRMDSDLKKSLETVCEEMGLSTTAVFTVFAKTVVRERKIPFEVCADSFYCAKNMAFLEEAVSELNKGNGKEHNLIEV